MDIFEVQDEGYSIARHILSETDEAQTSVEIGHLVGDISGHEMGQWLRALRVKGWVDYKVGGPGVAAVWLVTDEGKTELERYKQEINEAKEAEV